MSEALNLALEAVDEEHKEASAATRRQLVGGAAVALGGVAAATLPGVAFAGDVSGAGHTSTDPQTILNVAASAEVLATIVNTVGSEQGFLDATTQANVEAAAEEELIHYQVLRDFGGRPASRRIWVPDSVFASAENLLSTLEVGDQIFINAYMIGTTTFGAAGKGKLARFTAEFMGAEAVHGALARQSLGKLGNDRVFMKFRQEERAQGAPNRGQPGFTNILDAVKQLEGAGFGFGEKGDKPGDFYDFQDVRRRTPKNQPINTRKPD